MSAKKHRAENLGVQGVHDGSSTELTQQSRKKCIFRRHRGFTLWEMLIVVIIITVSISVILLSTSLGRDSNDLKVLGSDMSKLMQLLYQEAIFENRNFAISLKHDGYQVLEYDGQAWNESD